MQAGKALKTAAAFMLSVAMLATGAACGTSDDSDASASKSSSKSSELTGYDVSGVKKDDAIAKMLPDYVTKDGKLTIGMDTSYAPAEFLAADGKTPVGFDVDIAKALAGVFGLEADPETANFDSIIPAVGAKYDIGISSFTVTKERLEAVDFVSHFNAGSAWAVKKGNPNKVDTSDLCGKKVAVQTATMQETAANKMAKQCKADGKAEMDVISSKLQTDVTTNVVTGKADVFYADSPVAGYAIAQTDGELETLGKTEGIAPEGIVVKKGDQQMDEALQKALQKLKRALSRPVAAPGTLSDAEVPVEAIAPATKSFQIVEHEVVPANEEVDPAKVKHFLGLGMSASSIAAEIGAEAADVMAVIAQQNMRRSRMAHAA